MLISIQIYQDGDLGVLHEQPLHDLQVVGGHGQVQRGSVLAVEQVDLVGSAELSHLAELALPGGQVQLGQLLLLLDHIALAGAEAEVARALGLGGGRRESGFYFGEKVGHLCNSAAVSSKSALCGCWCLRLCLIGLITRCLSI